MTEYISEEFADICASDLRSFINIESQLINEEHDLLTKLMQWDPIIAHLEERIPSKEKAWIKLSDDVMESLIEIRDILTSGELQDLKFVKEEKSLFNQIKLDIAHKYWRAVKTDISTAKDKEKRVIKLEKNELKNLHSKFKALIKIMKNSKLMKFNITSLDKSAHKDLINYYFLQIFLFAQHYEHVFKHLLKKELIIYKK